MGTVVWLGDGARESWTLAKELCPLAIQVLDADAPDAAIADLMACLPFADTDEHLAALDDVVGSYRSNQKRMRYRTFRNLGLPVGSGIVESAHRHVLQVRMKRAGQRWGLVRARRLPHCRSASLPPRHPRRTSAVNRAASK